METTSIQNLLQQVSVINKKYEEIAEITGENFNIFKILGVQTAEVGTHSAFLCELLNPKGSHGCKDTFLKLFLEQQREKWNRIIKEYPKSDFLDCLNAFNPDHLSIHDEYYIGPIGEDKTEGGRIDILIKENYSNKAIIIENKIHATDGYNQLLRYKKAYPNSSIFYLTLNGKEPTVKSTGRELSKNDHYVCISYKKDIFDWLEACHKEACKYPLLRETITQYINLIKLLTKQNISKKMEKEILNIIFSSSENLESALLIDKNIIPDEIVRRIFESVEVYFEKEILKESEKYLYLKNLNFGFWGDEKLMIYMYENDWKYSICFEVDDSLDSLNIGIWAIEGKKDAFELDKEQIKLILKGLNLANDNKMYDSNTWVYFESGFWTNSPWIEVFKNAKQYILATTESIYKALKENNIDVTK